MPSRDEIDLAYRLLDLDLVDCEGRRCGKVDDLEFAGRPGKLTYVSAIRAGPGALPARFVRRLRRAAKRVFPARVTAIPSSAVEDFDAVVTLRQTAEELGLGQGDRILAAKFADQDAG
jgi:hypothetical protein